MLLTVGQLGDPEALDAILLAFQMEREAWLDLVQGLSAEQLGTRPGGGWSVVDLLFHVGAWQENALRVARLQAEPGAPELEPDQGVAGVLGIDVDGFNEEFMTALGDRSIDEAMAWSGEVHAQLVEALGALPPERLLGGTFEHGARRWYWRPAVVHPQEHRTEVGSRFGG